jgi:hypothetical protein
LSKLRSSDEQAAWESVEVVVSQALPQAREVLGQAEEERTLRAPKRLDLSKRRKRRGVVKHFWSRFGITTDEARSTDF